MYCILSASLVLINITLYTWSAGKQSRLFSCAVELTASWRRNSGRHQCTTLSSAVSRHRNTFPSLYSSDNRVPLSAWILDAHILYTFLCARAPRHSWICQRTTVRVVNNVTGSLQQLLLLIVITMMTLFSCVYLAIADGSYSLYSFTFTCNQIATLQAYASHLSLTMQCSIRLSVTVRAALQMLLSLLLLQNRQINYKLRLI